MVKIAQCMGGKSGQTQILVSSKTKFTLFFPEILQYLFILIMLFLHFVCYSTGYGLHPAGATDSGDSWYVASQSGVSGHSGYALSEESQEDDRSPGKVITYFP